MSDQQVEISSQHLSRPLSRPEHLPIWTRTRCKKRASASGRESKCHQSKRRLYRV